MAKMEIRILLADDDIDDCDLFATALVMLEEKYSFTTVHDGNQLIQYLKTCMVTSLPDIIFLDLNMPCKNGYECLVEIKSNDKWKNIPVIIFSTSFDQQTINQAYKVGARHYIGKPSSFEKLKKVIQSAVSSVFETQQAIIDIETFVLKP